MAAPSPTHEERKAILDAVATLAGFILPWRLELPDGSRPDVARTSRCTSGIFLGDAKATESPGTWATTTRLITYGRWVHAAATEGGLAVLALCTNVRNSRAWSRTLVVVGSACGDRDPMIEVVDLSSCSIVSWTCAPLHPRPNTTVDSTSTRYGR